MINIITVDTVDKPFGDPHYTTKKHMDILLVATNLVGSINILIDQGSPQRIKGYYGYMKGYNLLINGVV